MNGIFFFQAEDGIRYYKVTGVQTCALPIYDLVAHLQHLLLELEGRDAEGEEAPDALVAIEHHRLHAVAHQDVGARQARRPRADDRDALVRRAHVRHVRPPAGLERLVGDVLLDRTDADSAQPVIERAGALAQAILRADAAAHFGERVGLVGQLRRLEQIPLLDQLQPVGDVVVNRALPLAEGIAAAQAAPRLLCRAARIVGGVDLAEIAHPRLHRRLGWIRARDVEELQVLVGHVARAFRPRAAGSRPASRWRPPWASPPRTWAERRSEERRVGKEC